ncbi:hypothetical protein [Acetobacter sp.]|uniref:hypothetical protein n=1 Tax=Acetobacter sp. TaxID=440 RepID=UPI0039E764D0
MDLSSYSSDQNLRMWALQQAQIGCRQDDLHNRKAFALAAEIEQFVRTGKKPGQHDAGRAEPMPDAPSEQAKAQNAGSETRAADGADKIDVDRKKRKAEEALICAAKVGLKITSIRETTGSLAIEWTVPRFCHPGQTMGAEIATALISAGLNELYVAGVTCSVSYDRTGYPNVSWRTVSAA